MTLAQLIVLETAKNPRKRLAGKLYAVRGLRRIGLSREDRAELFRLVDWLVALPDDLQSGFDEEIEREEEEGTMPFVTGIERRATERGRQEGRQEGWQQATRELVLEVLEMRFGPVPQPVVAGLQEVDDAERLRALHRLALGADTLDGFAAQLETPGA